MVVSDRLRVFIVATGSEQLSAVRARLERDAAFHIVGHALLSDVQTGATVIPPGVDLVLMPPAALDARAATPVRASRSQPSADDRLLEQLTPRERTVLALVADGLPNREIAQELAISEHTVKFHLASVFGKLGVSSRTEAVRRGLQLGLIEI
jgi:DNA-binding NarL/FixJ family response regulator